MGNLWRAECAWLALVRTCSGDVHPSLAAADMAADTARHSHHGQSVMSCNAQRNGWRKLFFALEKFLNPLDRMESIYQPGL